MITPPYLQVGDSIAIAASARFVTKEDLIEPINILKEFGFNVLVHENLFEINNQLAGTDENRALVLNEYLKNDNVKAILFARGGYGSTRMIDLVDWSLLTKNPKWLAGFSDVTAILNHVDKLGISSIHSIMPLLFIKENAKESIISLIEILKGEKNIISAPKHILNVIGECEGELIGGNLSLLVHIVGTESEPVWKGKFLFLEDLDEYLYHVDRMMIQLKRAGVLAQLKGIVVGYMSDMKDNATPWGKNAYEIIAEHCAELGIPLAFGLPVGHEIPNLALKIGGVYKLSVETSGTTLSLI
ncbi:MAG: hypothetical protein RLZZ175_1810 [Bacteroidota bacterium]|jgi:muramoyltetrapeptide carboxypeptidase